GQGFDTITARLRPFVAEFSRSDFFRGLVEGVQRIPELFDRAVEAIINAWDATEGLRTAFGNLVAGGAAIIQFVINLNNWLGGIPGILAGIAAALALLYAYPVIAGLGL